MVSGNVNSRPRSSARYRPNLLALIIHEAESFRARKGANRTERGQRRTIEG